MNVINHILRYKKVLVLALACTLAGSLGAMYISKRKAYKKRSEQQQPRRVGLGEVWVKTSDGKIIAIPQWQIDQMKVLQVMFLQQKGKNAENNPVEAPMITPEQRALGMKPLIITSGQLKLLQGALESATSAEKFAIFCGKLGPDEEKDLINSAFAVEAIGLAALLMVEIFPQEVQERLGAVYLNVAPRAILEPVVEYVNKSQKTILQGYKGFVTCVAYSPDGKYIVSGSSDKKLILWDGETGKQIQILQGHKSFIKCVAYSPDGKYIVSGSNDENLILWNGTTGEQIKTLTGHWRPVNVVTYSPDGK